MEIYFPGLGIDKFTLNPIAIPFGDNDGIRWYALCIVAGMILAITYCMLRAKSEGIVPDTMLDFAIFTIPVGIIGTRLYYVFFDWLDAVVNNQPNPYQSFTDVIAIWNGGLAIYGGIIFGAITIIVVAKVKKMSGRQLLKITDSVAPGVMIAQAMGRWGNFFNGEAYGTPTALPWRMCSDKFATTLSNKGLISEEVKDAMLDGTLGVHPTFLYESLWNVLGFVLINLVYKKKRFDGQIVLMYVAWYGLGRTFIELLRTDSLTNGGGIRVSSLLGLLSFIVAGSILLCLFIKNKGRKSFGPIEFAETFATAKAVEESENVAEEAADETEVDSIDTPPENEENKNQENINNNDCEEKNDGKID